MVEGKASKSSAQQSRDASTDGTPKTRPSADRRKEVRARLSEFKSEPEVDVLLDRADRALARYVDAMAGKYSEAELMLPLINMRQAHIEIAQSIGTMHPDVASRFFSSIDPNYPKTGIQSFLAQFERSVHALSNTIREAQGTGGDHQDRNMRRLLRSLISIWGDEIVPGKGGDPAKLTEGNAGRAFIHAVLKRAKKSGVKFPFKRSKKTDQGQGDGISDEAIKKYIRKYFSQKGRKSQFVDWPSVVTEKELTQASLRMIAKLSEFEPRLTEQPQKKPKK